MSTEYIHVDTATKTPVIRTGNGPFEKHNRDPNLSSAFGPDQATMFLPVVRGDAPEVIEPVLKKTKIPKTGEWDGFYDGTNWVVTPVLEDQEVASSRNEALNLLEEDFQSAADLGFTVGTTRYPLNEEFFRILQTRASFMQDAVAGGKISPNKKVSFKSDDGKVEKTTLEIREEMLDYGVAYFDMLEIKETAEEEIRLATTAEDVNKVKWNFKN